MNNDIVYEDTTLRDGEQSPGIAFGRDTKIAIFTALRALGVRWMEVGIPAMGGSELAVIRELLERGSDLMLIGWNRGKLDDVVQSLDLGFRAIHIGLPASDITVEEGDTDTAPYGLGTYASRSTPTAGAAAAMAARKIKAKAKKIAAHLLEVGEDDLEWNVDRFQVKGSPDQAKTIQDIAFAAYTNHPQGMEAGLEATDYYDPPNLTFPFGSYIAVVDVDKGTGEVKVRRFVAVDDCGNIITPLIVEGQIHGGLTMGLAPALYEEIVYDENGQNLSGTFADYLVPTAVESPKWETGHTITPSPHHPLGAKGVGESPTVGAPPAIANAVVDALWHLGVRHLDIPITPPKVWKALRDAGVTE